LKLQGQTADHKQDQRQGVRV